MSRAGHTFFRILLSSPERYPMRLKEIRKARGISQVKMAMDLNVSQNTVSRYETGEREADYAMLIRIADYFGVSIDYLLCRTDRPEVNR